MMGWMKAAPLLLLGVMLLWTNWQRMTQQEQLIEQQQHIRLADTQIASVTAPRPVGRGFPLLRPLPSVRRIYAGLHGQKRRVPPPLVPVFLFAGY